MKSIFIDCNNQLAPVFARARRSDDPPIAVNTELSVVSAIAAVGARS